jgi:multimeric flavodoxin WrbA
MKIISVMGSPTKDGNTCVIAREVMRGSSDSGAEVEEIFLGEYNIEFCKGCISRNVKNHCMATGSCIINDDLNMLKKKLYNADGIILASPSYGLMETARMKNFIADRIGMYTVYTSSLAGKYFVGVSTCGGFGAKKVAKTLANHFLAGFHQRSYMTGYIGVAVGNDRIEKKQKELEKAYALGKKLVSDINNGRKYPFQKLFDRLVTSLIIRKVILKNIYRNKDGMMKAVYNNLVDRKLINP